MDDVVLDDYGNPLSLDPMNGLDSPPVTPIDAGGTPAIMTTNAPGILSSLDTAVANAIPALGGAISSAVSKNLFPGAGGALNPSAASQPGAKPILINGKPVSSSALFLLIGVALFVAFALKR